MDEIMHIEKEITPGGTLYSVMPSGAPCSKVALFTNSVITFYMILHSETTAHSSDVI